MPQRRPTATGPLPSRARSAAAAALALALALAVTLGSSPALADATPTPTPSPTDCLGRVWPGHPEWLAMLAEILAGRAPEAGQGWYRRGTSRTRFDWARESGRLDRDGDGSIARAECPGLLDDFDRLDRDGDGHLTPADFAFPAGGPGGIESFATADADADGEVDPAELAAFARSSGADPVDRLTLQRPLALLERRLEAARLEGAGSLTLADFQEAFDLGSRGGATASPARPRRAALAPAEQARLFRAFLRQEIGAFSPGPDLDAKAPDFTLTTADGSTSFHLAGEVGPRPIVLIFGNFSCGPFRSHAGGLEQLARRHGDRARFVVVYTREAHPVDGWSLDDGPGRKVDFRQPTDLGGRSALANTCREALRLSMPVLVDAMDDHVGRLYSGMPSRLYLIDPAGTVAYKGGRGPFGFRPAELEQALIFLLEGRPRAGSSRPPKAEPRPSPAGSTIPRPFAAEPVEAGRALGWLAAIVGPLALAGAWLAARRKGRRPG